MQFKTCNIIRVYPCAPIHVMHYALRYFHLLNRCSYTLQGAPLVRMAMEGLKRLQGKGVQKVAAIPGIILEALIGPSLV